MPARKKIDLEKVMASLDSQKGIYFLLQVKNMTAHEADIYIIGHWETTARENDERATQLELMAQQSLDLARGTFMVMEAKLLREQAARFREAATTLSATAA
jgi:hypothetical protein